MKAYFQTFCQKCKEHRAQITTNALKMRIRFGAVVKSDIFMTICGDELAACLSEPEIPVSYGYEEHPLLCRGTVYVPEEVAAVVEEVNGAR